MHPRNPTFLSFLFQCMTVVVDFVQYFSSKMCRDSALAPSSVLAHNNSVQYSVQYFSSIADVCSYVLSNRSRAHIYRHWPSQWIERIQRNCPIPSRNNNNNKSNLKSQDRALKIIRSKEEFQPCLKYSLGSIIAAQTILQWTKHCQF